MCGSPISRCSQGGLETPSHSIRLESVLNDNDGGLCHPFLTLASPGTHSPSVKPFGGMGDGSLLTEARGHPFKCLLFHIKSSCSN